MRVPGIIIGSECEHIFVNRSKKKNLNKTFNNVSFLLLNFQYLYPKKNGKTIQKLSLQAVRCCIVLGLFLDRVRVKILRSLEKIKCLEYTILKIFAFSTLCLLNLKEILGKTTQKRIN